MLRYKNCGEYVSRSSAEKWIGTDFRYDGDTFVI